MARNVSGFPDDPIFAQLLQVARDVNHVIVHDPGNKVDADYAQLLTDILRMQTELRAALHQPMFSDDGILLEQTPYIFILADGKYEFIVAAFAILSIGGAVVPLSPTTSPEETTSLLHRTHSTTILTSKTHLSHSTAIQSPALTSLTILPIPINTTAKLAISSPLLTLNPTPTIPATRPALLLFTSGTSGPPKGVVHTRALFHEIHLASGPNHVFLHHRPPNWITGALPLFRHPLAGARMEITPSDPETIWMRLRAGTEDGVQAVSMLIGPPRFWGSLMKYYRDVIANLPEIERIGYIDGVQKVKIARVGGTMPHALLVRFWRREIGIPLLVSYGATELGGRGLRTSLETGLEIERCIGRPQPGVKVRLSEGDHGEMEIWNPVLFSHYLGDEKATKAAFTKDGYYRTGDLAHREGDEYIFDGRAGEFIKFLGHKISIVELEMRLLEQPFISDACVLPVTDAGSNERVAAVIRLQENITQASESVLEVLRQRLTDTGLVPGYMLPTALRVLRQGEEIPRTASMKVLRRQAAEKFFSLSDRLDFPDSVERWPKP
ncbi:hypothetical protein BJY04DRAFT_223495 [Aspergillus karnatakaensis]|uniref:class I adenylate-forming enzyme family protein n=1 Tax=Aspergillus karnatakaensis TaxID=1810916 RepID=UPI003CCCA4AB